MIGEVIIRDARPNERAIIRELTLRAYAEHAAVMQPSAWEGLRDAIRSALGSEEPAERIVAERGGALVASVLLFSPEASAYGGAAGGQGAPEIRMLAVAPEARGQGLGEALVAECIRRARQAGASEIGLHTSHSLRAAIRLYERLGFARAPQYDFQPPGAELVMGYRLNI